MKNTCIIYNAGAYGTLIEWVLTDFLKDDYTIPFTSIGNAHNFEGHFLYSYFDKSNGYAILENPPPIMDKLREYVDSSINHDVVRFHSMASMIDTDQFDQIVGYVNDNFKKTILIHPTWDSFLWNMNNAEYKVHAPIRENANKKHYSPFLANWGVTDINDAEIWQLREFLSIYKYQQFLSETQIELIPTIKEKYPNVHFLSLDSLKNNFTQTIVDLLAYCELPTVDIDRITSLRDIWIDKQTYIDRDQLVRKIVNAVVNNEYYEWENETLTLIDEAMIQHYLREKNLDIRCWKLNTFPTNTDILRNYIDHPA